MPTTSERQKCGCKKWCNNHWGRGLYNIYIHTHTHRVYTLGNCQTLVLQKGLMPLTSVSNTEMTPPPAERVRRLFSSDLHAGVGFLLWEVAGESEVGDTNMAVFIQQDISWLRGRERERETVILMTENTRDTIISIGNNVRDLTNSWLKNNFRPAAENSVWTRADKRRKKPSCPGYPPLFGKKKKKKKRDSKYYLHCSALFIEALKLFPDFQQNISVIMATSPNRGIGGKTEESWKHGWCESMALREYLWRCAGREGLILCHMSFFSLCCFLQLSTQRSDDETFI